jgi:arylsulfatase A-like enzyme
MVYRWPCASDSPILAWLVGATSSNLARSFAASAARIPSAAAKTRALCRPLWLSGFKQSERIDHGILQEINFKGRPMSEEDVRYLVGLYDAGIRSVDEAFGNLVAEMRSRGLYDRTLIVFTSDHGEELGERGKYGWHSHELYDEFLRVPLIVKLPYQRGAGAEVFQQVSHVDVLPTILDVVDLPVEPSFQGRSLLSLTVSEKESARHDGGAVISQRDDGKRFFTSVRTPVWKLHVWRVFQLERLYDLQADPLEKKNVASGQPEVVQRLQTEFSDALAGKKPRESAPRVELDAETLEQLRILGYHDEPR